MARLATRKNRLAREICAYPVGVRGNCPAPLAGGEGSILVQNRAEEESARRGLKKAGAELSTVEFFRVPTDRGWIRDFGPVFVRAQGGELAAPTGNSMPGQSMTTASVTPQPSRALRRSFASGRFLFTSLFIAGSVWSLKAAGLR